ncbi:MAG TPA: RNA methyltransferase [Bryobacteraceae bacterium]|nr:RNA methyltransferase [Bryobacteraceae bacterium]
MDSLSDQNPLVKQIRRAVSRGTLTEDGYAVAEGVHLVVEAVAARCEIRAVIFSESAKPGVVSDLARDTSRLPEPRQVTEKTFRSMSSTETPQGVLALVKPPAADLAQVFSGDALVVILDGVQEPGNAGAIVRVAEAFGATGAIFMKGTVDPFHPRCLRGSAGSALRLPVIAHFNPAHVDPAHFNPAHVDPAHFDGDLNSGTVMDGLRALRVYAAMPRPAGGRAHETSSIELGAADFTVPCAIVIGGEGRGVSEPMAAIAIPVHIPTTKVESLNAAVAAGILLYEARRQRDSRTKDTSQKASG